MYNNYFGFRERPFSVSPDPRYLYQTQNTQEALASLIYGIESRKGFILLTGEVGTGKTTLLNGLLDWLKEKEIPSAFIFNSQLSIRQLFDFIMADFGIPCESRQKSHMLMALNQWVLERYRSGKTTVLVVDESQNLPLQVLEEIRLLSNLETSNEKLIQIVLSGQPEFEEKLKLPELRQLRQRIVLHCRTTPLSCEETRAYIAERLRIAGSTGEPIFSDEAIVAVHRHSRGIPRVVNLLCEHALINAFADQQRPVLAPSVEGIAREFKLNEIARIASPAPTQGDPVFSSAPEGDYRPPEHLADSETPAVVAAAQAAAVAPSLAPKLAVAARAAESPSSAARPSPHRETMVVLPPPNSEARVNRAESRPSSGSLPGVIPGRNPTRSTFTPTLEGVGVSRNMREDSSGSKRLVLTATAAVVLVGLSVGGFLLHQQTQAQATVAHQAVPSPDVVPTPTSALLQKEPITSVPVGLSVATSSTSSRPREVSAVSLRRSMEQLATDARPAQAPTRRAILEIGNLRAPTSKSSAMMSSSEPPPVLSAQANSFADPEISAGLLVGASSGNPPQPPPEEPRTLVGGQLQAPKLVSSLPPSYPPTARAQRVQGVVVVNILVETTGKVAEMAVVSGHPLLQGAALAALRNWIYEPARLNGQPVAVHEKVSLRFALN